MTSSKKAEFKDLEGKTLFLISGLEEDSEEIKFLTRDGREFSLYHESECCETVKVTEIIGDATDLLDSEILLAEERTNEKQDLPPNNKRDKSWTWTFYELATIKGRVTIRWYGGSWNGYYSEKAKFKEIVNDKIITKKESKYVTRD